jgi:hypothetical protein
MITKKHLLCAIVSILFCGFTAVFAQDGNAPDAEQAPPDSKWKTSGMLSWAYNQTSVSKNWAGKEKYSRIWQIKLFLSAERNDEKSNWTTTLKEEYGESSLTNASNVNLDFIEFNTVYIYKIAPLLQPYASFMIQTQNNRFWDPVTYVESVGLSFTLFGNDINTLKLRVGGSLKQRDDSMHGNMRDAGAESVLNYDLLFHKDAKFVSEARLFESFKNGEDFSWDNKLFFLMTPWLTTEFGYKVFYDRARIRAHNWPHDVETLAYVSVGLSFNIFQR